MARAERQVPSIYLGRPGAVVQLPWPRGDLERSYQRQSFDFVTGSGQHAISLLTAGARSYNVNWNALHVDNFSLLEAFWSGTNGAGPWALIDPSTPNMLLPNQASATNALYDTTGFATSTGAANMGTLLSNSATAGNLTHRTGTQRSLRWQFTVAAATTPILTFTSPYRNWFGYPAVAGLPYAWSFWARPDGTVDTSITLAAIFQWLDSAGVQIGSDVTGGAIVMSSGYVKLSVTGTAPAGTAYIKPLAVATGSTITTGGSIYLDEPLLEQDSAFNNWAPGTGVRAIEITSLVDIAPFEARMRRGCTMTVQELPI
jgi:hypothetical protein